MCFDVFKQLEDLEDLGYAGFGLEFFEDVHFVSMSSVYRSVRSPSDPFLVSLITAGHA